MACGGDDDRGDMAMDDGMVAPVAGADITVNLTNWEIAPSPREVQSGTLKVAAVHPRDKVGETKAGEVELEPGEYELACLVVEKSGGKTYDHYEEGMHTSITVK